VVKIVKAAEQKGKLLPVNNVKLSRAEKLSLLGEIERIANSEHVALMQKINRLREAIASD
jgi:hypothetical protein